LRGTAWRYINTEARGYVLHENPHPGTDREEKACSSVTGKKSIATITDSSRRKHAGLSRIRGNFSKMLLPLIYGEERFVGTFAGIKEKTTHK
jgi:hypothetical protein